MLDYEELSDDQSASEAEDNPKVFENEAQKREYHNELKRKRREALACSFKYLKNILPYSKKKKASRVQILKKACDFIQRHPTLQTLKDKIESLKEENRLMEKTIKTLQDAMSNKDLETIAKYVHINLPLKHRHYLLENDDEGSDNQENSNEDSSSRGFTPLEPSPVIASVWKRSKKNKKKALHFCHY